MCISDFFIFGKLIEWRCFVTYLWNDPRRRSLDFVCRYSTRAYSGVLAWSVRRDEVQRASTAASALLRHLHDPADDRHIIHESTGLPASLRLRRKDRAWSVCVPFGRLNNDKCGYWIIIKILYMISPTESAGLPAAFPLWGKDRTWSVCFLPVHALLFKV